jgi:hypothetical protein
MFNTSSPLIALEPTGLSLQVASIGVDTNSTFKNLKKVIMWYQMKIFIVRYIHECSFSDGDQS